jgi:hypothetical protein
VNLSASLNLNTCGLLNTVDGVVGCVAADVHAIGATVATDVCEVTGLVGGILGGINLGGHCY